MTQNDDVSNEKPADEETGISMESVLKEINSHYLFDTLHAIKGYTMLDERKAMEMINLLAKAMRQGIGMLKEGKSCVCLSDELQYARLYLDIAKLHYGEMECEIIHNSDDFTVPIFAIRHLIEDAFTRCLAVKPQERKLRVYTFSDSTHDYIEIKDTGIPLSEDEIKNLMKYTPEAKRNAYLLCKSAGWRVEICGVKEEGNRVALSREKK